MPEYIARHIETHLQTLANFFPVILVTGPRQAGKTTLLQHCREQLNREYRYISLDDLSVRALATQDPEQFLRQFPAPLIIDEFQEAPELLPLIKLRVDELNQEAIKKGQPLPTAQYLLTGSQVFQSMASISESLAGRVGIVQLPPLSTREIAGLLPGAFIPGREQLEKRTPAPRLEGEELFRRIWRGSYPRLYNEPQDDANWENFYATYVTTYVERDLRLLLDVAKETTFLRFVTALAARTGQEYNASDLSRDVEVDVKTVERWLSILKNTFLIYLLPAYASNDTQRAIRRPKIYFMDTGLACYLAGYPSPETLSRSQYAGPIFETYVVSEIIKSWLGDNRDPRTHLYYYRDQRKREINLLIQDGQRLYPAEIKKTANPTPADAKNLELATSFGIESPNGTLICLSRERYGFDDYRQIVPLEYV